MREEPSTEDQIRVRVRELMGFADAVVGVFHPAGDTEDGKRKHLAMLGLSRAALAAKLNKMILDECGVE
jgi:hypothetical protein